jgi:hypothetical protein
LTKKEKVQAKHLRVEFDHSDYQERNRIRSGFLINNHEGIGLSGQFEWYYGSRRWFLV